MEFNVNKEPLIRTYVFVSFVSLIAAFEFRISQVQINMTKTKLSKLKLDTFLRWIAGKCKRTCCFSCLDVSKMSLISLNHFLAVILYSALTKISIQIQTQLNLIYRFTFCFVLLDIFRCVLLSKCNLLQFPGSLFDPSPKKDSDAKVTTMLAWYIDNTQLISKNLLW